MAEATEFGDMAEEQQRQQEEESRAEGQATEGGGGTGTAVKAAAAAAATGVAALAARKALSNRSGSNGSSNGTSAAQKDEGPSVLSNVLAGGWEAARGALVPAAEDAAGAVGEYLAHNGPDFLRERILPRFIDSFNEARGER